MDNFNIIDLTIVTLSWIELSTLWHAHDTGNLEDNNSASSASIMVFRLLRLARMFHVINYFERLNMLAWAFLRSLQDIFWVGILILFFLYIFGVLACNFFGNNDHLKNQLTLRGMGDIPEDLFGTVTRSMLTLFQMMTLDSWMSGITRPIGDVYVMAFPFFIVLTFLSALGMLNLLTAIFVESLAELSKDVSDEKDKEALEERRRMVELVKLTFRRYDLNHNGRLEGEELNHVLEELATPAYAPVLRVLGIDVETLRSFMVTCDMDGSGGCDYDDFCFGIMSMNAPPKKRDTWEIYSLLKQNDRTMRRELELVRTRQDRIEQSLNAKLDLLLEYNRIPVPGTSVPGT